MDYTEYTKGDKMSFFDKSKDKEITKEEIDRGNYKLVVSLNSYDDGPIKLQISRINLTEDGERFTKVGRLNKDDVQQLIPVMQGLLSKMDTDSDQLTEEPVM